MDFLLQQNLIGSSDNLDQEQPAYLSLFNPSDKAYRIWKVLMFIVGIYISWSSPYLFGFVFDLTEMWKNQEYVVCAILLVDCLVSVSTVYFDEHTNAIVKDRRRIIKHYLYGLGAIELVSVLPLPWVVLPFHATANVLLARVWTLIRLVHIRKVFYTLKSWKQSSKPTLICVAKWIQIIFITLFAIHCKACMLYLIARIYPKFEKTWLNLVDDEKAKQSNGDLYDYSLSLYWSTTSFTTVGYGDIHPVNTFERMLDLTWMVFGVGLISYLSSCVNELLARSNQRKKLLEALQEFYRNISLSDELRQEMLNHLSQQSHGDLDMMSEQNILDFFPKNIQTKVKIYLFSQLNSLPYLFHRVSTSFLSHMVAEMEFQTFKSNEMVIIANEFATNFSILLNGNIVRLNPNNVQETTLHICGEFGVITQLPHPYSVQTTERSTLLTMKWTKFMKLLKVCREDGEIIFSNMLQYLEARQVDPVLNLFYKSTQRKLDQGEIEIKLSVDFAIRRNNPRLLLHLIKQGAVLEEEDATGMTILHIAAMTPNIDPRLMSILLQYSSDINKRDSTNNPPISYAIETRGAVLDVFRARGVTVPSDKVAEYFKSAIVGDNLELLQLVHELGGDINLPINENGDTPIYHAVVSEKVEVIKELLRLKADMHKENIKGVSALGAAAKLDSRVIFRMLYPFGRDDVAN